MRAVSAPGGQLCSWPDGDHENEHRRLGLNGFFGPARKRISVSIVVVAGRTKGRRCEDCCRPPGCCAAHCYTGKYWEQAASVGEHSDGGWAGQVCGVSDDTHCCTGMGDLSVAVAAGQGHGQREQRPDSEPDAGDGYDRTGHGDLQDQSAGGGEHDQSGSDLHGSPLADSGDERIS